MNTHTHTGSLDLDFVIDLSTAPKRPTPDPAIEAMLERLRAATRAAALGPPPIDYSDRRPPTLPAEQISGGRVKIWCAFCKAYHIHGQPSGDGTRRRSAPCGSQCGNDRSPYRSTGYLLHVVEPGFHKATMRRSAPARR